jgi:hypothetical protein
MPKVRVRRERPWWNLYGQTVVPVADRNCTAVVFVRHGSPTGVINLGGTTARGQAYDLFASRQLGNSGLYLRYLRTNQPAIKTELECS